MAYPCENNLAGGIECNMTSFYGHPEVSKRELSWHFLQLIKSETKLPWFCFSDFNKINKTSEKKVEAVDHSHKWKLFKILSLTIIFMSLTLLELDSLGQTNVLIAPTQKRSKIEL